MSAAEKLDTLFHVIEGGQQVVQGQIVQFPTDKVVEGQTVLEGIKSTYYASNGTAAQVSQLASVAAGTAGVALLALPVTTIGMAIAPFLGIAAGIGLYSLGPDFWTDVSNNLLNACATVEGKVMCFLNESTGKAGVSETVLNIFKDAFISAGVYDVNPHYRQEDIFNQMRVPFYVDNKSRPLPDNIFRGVQLNERYHPVFVRLIGVDPDGTTHDATVFASSQPVDYYVPIADLKYPVGYDSIFARNIFTYDDKTVYYSNPANSWVEFLNTCGVIPSGIDVEWWGDLDWAKIAWSIVYGEIPVNPNLEEDAVYPREDEDISVTYPSLVPWNVPGLEDNIFNIDINPKKDTNQNKAQNPDPDPDDDSWFESIMNNIVLPEPVPVPDPVPVPVPVPDPDPIPEAVEPIPIPIEEAIPENPIEPIPPIPIPPPPVVPIIPEEVESNAMFTVYQPSASQLNQLGAWLWDTNIIEQITRMWQNPLDGIIAFMKVYAIPTIARASTIKLGYIDSEVPSNVVGSQFVTVNCGTISVDEIKRNATDYTPYVSIHLYLPFIGIVELDVSDFMDGSIKVRYKIDMYTGTCLAEVLAIRSEDMPSESIIYTFSGNASQQLPLTGSNFQGMLSGLVGVATGALTVATGGAVAGIAGAGAIGHSLTHEMVHIGRSGSMSANSGIMGCRTPYIIIGRKHPYDANGYNELYGYPANKTVFLGNCSGFTRVKACRLRTKATDDEKQEILEFLENGVIF